MKQNEAHQWSFFGRFGRMGSQIDQSLEIWPFGTRSCAVDMCVFTTCQLTIGHLILCEQWSHRKPYVSSSCLSHSRVG